MSFEKDDYIKYRMQKSLATINEVKVLIDNNFWNTAINRMYYACFYAVGALLAKNNINAQSHSGCLLQLGKHFVKTNIIDKEVAIVYSRLFEKRQKGDYTDFFDFDKESVVIHYEPAVIFINTIQELLNK